MIYDIKLIDKKGVYDFTLANNGDIAMTESIENAVLMSIFCEKRASDTEEVIGKRGGWFGNLFNDISGYETGSKLWLYKQARNTLETRNKIRATITDGLAWMIDDGMCDNINVNVVNNNINSIEISIYLYMDRDIIFSNKYIV